MARKLTKKTLAGQPLVRRPQVEAELSELRKLGQTELIERIRGSSGGAKGRCSTEAMMALLRDGQSERVLNELIVRIHSRFASVAEHKLKSRNAFSEEALENVMSAFNEALAADIATRCEKLDFFEASFSLAVAGFIHSEVRREISRRLRYVSMTPTDDDEDSGADDADAFVDVDSLSLRLSHPEREVFTQQLLAVLSQLPRELRDVAVPLALGVPKESTDPNETTIATMCQIKRRAIQYRQERLVQKLANFKE
ncbi:hypothetical protein ACFSHT_24775 [Paraburkholderia silviterrae]|uniref:Uncharacterized protein n=1 Tax=Paraburkholderia silviterrae TaxID=2528715 RepID=A0A4R5MCR0_9BURK|nr:hypothetical protein [Paraburkholderia silviterrae]TDG24159.1 hypothetical protein EYW47_11720 [Paraburkholderia silviterrae]